MKIVQVDDYYIELLRNEFPTIMDGKRFHRSHTRKYVGIIFSIGKFNYYAPFSSPKSKDYNLDGSIKKNSIFTIHMIKDGENGQRVLLGTIKLNNMIPIPEKYVLNYLINAELDSRYRDIISDEFKWISENQSSILKRARQLYFFKKNENKLKNENNAKVYGAVLPFTKIEEFIVRKFSYQRDDEE